MPKVAQQVHGAPESHVVNSSGSASCTPREQGRDPPTPSLARCPSLSQSMLTEWLCWSDNDLRQPAMLTELLAPQDTWHCPSVLHPNTGHFLVSIPPPHQPGPALETRKPAGQSWASLLSPTARHGGWAGQRCLMARGSGTSTGFRARETWVPVPQLNKCVPFLVCTSFYSPVKWVLSFKAAAWPSLTMDACVHLPPPFLHRGNAVRPKLSCCPAPTNLLHLRGRRLLHSGCSGREPQSYRLLSLSPRSPNSSEILSAQFRCIQNPLISPSHHLGQGHHHICWVVPMFPPLPRHRR